MSIDKLRKRIATGEIIIMDGGTGTEILRRGVKTTLPLWSADALFTHPEVVQSIHTDYIRSGAEIIITNTFRTQRRTFTKKGVGDQAGKITILACKLARYALEKTKPGYDVYIAGSIAPLEDCYSPNLTPNDNQLKKEHLEHAKNLKKGGVDFLLVETMNTIKEAVIALQAAKKVGLPIAVSFCCNDNLKLLSGERLEDVVKNIEKYNPLFLSINCTSIFSTTKIVKKLRKLTRLSLGVYANGDGIPDDDQGWRFTGIITPEKYLNYAKQWLKSGVQVVGGCCGTTPEYIRMLSEHLPKRVH